MENTFNQPEVVSNNNEVPTKSEKKTIGIQKVISKVDKLKIALQKLAENENDKKAKEEFRNRAASCAIHCLCYNKKKNEEDKKEENVSIIKKILQFVVICIFANLFILVFMFVHKDKDKSRKNKDTKRDSKKEEDIPMDHNERFKNMNTLPSDMESAEVK